MARPTSILVTLAAIVAFYLLPPILQDPRYHHFADQRTIAGIPNFWNVMSNLPFLFVAIYGCTALVTPNVFRESWERRAYIGLLVATALTAFGSAYYHASPSDDTLFWDRLPMTVIFMSLLASVAGERLGIRVGRLMYLGLLAVGAAALYYWKLTGDLRPYGFVQFYPAVILPLIVVLFPARYSGLRWLILTGVLYLAAKLHEAYDRQISDMIVMGGHPLKHLFAAGALLSYVHMVRTRKRMDEIVISPISSRSRSRG